MRVGIFSGGDDDQAVHIASYLESLGVGVVRVEPELFPGDLRISDRDGRWFLGTDPLDDVVAWYVRFYHFFPLADEISTRERDSLLTALLSNADGRLRVVNPVAALRQNREKPYQLHLLRQAGIPLPRTLISNDPDLVREFVAQVPEVVYKPVAGGALANPWKKADSRRLGHLKSGPVIFQERIRGESLRVHVLDGEVIGCALIHSDLLDYRSGDFEQEHVDLPKPVAAMCVKACKAAGMRFTGLDVIRSAGDAYTVIEANPTPYYLVFEKALVEPITERLVQYLLGQNGPRRGAGGRSAK